MSTEAVLKPFARAVLESARGAFSTPSRRLTEVLRLHDRTHGYVPALLCFIVALGGHLLLIRVLGPSTPLILLVYVCTMLIASWCGYGPGLLMVTLIVCVAPFFLRPAFSLSQVHLGGFGTLLLVSLLVSRTAATRRRIEGTLRVTNKSLDARVRQQTNRLEARLAELETLYAKLPVGLALLDRELRFVRINERLAAINSLAIDDHLGRTLRAVVAPQIVDAVEERYLRVLETGEPLAGFEVSSPGGADRGPERTWLVDCARVLTDNGTVLGVQVVMQEITERKRAEAAIERANAELRRANADLEQFAYSASHDLQEPLRMVTIFTQMLGRKYAGRLDDSANEYIANTIAGAQRLELLIKGLRTYMKVTHADAPPDNVDTTVILERCLSNLRTVIEKSGAQIEYGSLPNVNMYEVHVEQLFQNLIGNAIKYRRQDAPQVRIHGVKDGEFWRFSVADNGIGIDPRYAEQIFGVFKRLHGNAEFEGAGIGLAICQKIVERYSGRIWVESQAGAGSTFHFTIPVAQHVTRP
jgi:PAS domain S-box-containing protein